MKYNPSLLIFILILSISCQPRKTSSSRAKQKIQIQSHLDDLIEGQYLGVFVTLNPQITSKITGAFTFSVEKITGEVVTDVRLNNAGAEIIHAQNVRMGNRCPTINDDLNADGIIDALEGEKVYGKIFIPLDGDISSQSSHDGEFPMGDTYGDYIYTKVANFQTFIKDLRNLKHPAGYIKLKDLEPFNIENRAVVIHGVDTSADLPITVNSLGGTSKYQNLPIVCGIIKKVVMPPGHIDDEAISFW